jgi:hypothetical protein
MATKKKTRKRTGMINLTTLRRLAKKVYGDVEVAEDSYQPYRRRQIVWRLRVKLSGDLQAWSTLLVLEHEDHSTARRMLKAALEAAL